MNFSYYRKNNIIYDISEMLKINVILYIFLLNLFTEVDFNKKKIVLKNI